MSKNSKANTEARLIVLAAVVSALASKVLDATENLPSINVGNEGLNSLVTSIIKFIFFIFFTFVFYGIARWMIDEGPQTLNKIFNK